MSAWAVPGMKCVCKDDSNWNFRNPSNRFRANLPVKGQVYTVKDTWIGLNGIPCVSLEELDNSHIPAAVGPEPGFRTIRFVPLIIKTQEQDVSMFKSLLNRTSINETA